MFLYTFILCQIIQYWKTSPGDHLRYSSFICIHFNTNITSALFQTFANVWKMSFVPPCRLVHRPIASHVSTGACQTTSGVPHRGHAGGWFRRGLPLSYQEILKRKRPWVHFTRRQKWTREGNTLNNNFQVSKATKGTNKKTNKQVFC